MERRCDSLAKRGMAELSRAEKPAVYVTTVVPAPAGDAALFASSSQTLLSLLSIFVSVSVSPFASLFLPSLSHAISPQLVTLTEVAKRAQAVLRYLDAVWYSKYRSSTEISTFPLLHFFFLFPFYSSSFCYCSFSQRREAELGNGDGNRGRKLQKAPCQRAGAFTSAEVRRGRLLLCVFPPTSAENSLLTGPNLFLNFACSRSRSEWK